MKALRKIKKITYLLLTAIMVFLGACGNTAESEPEIEKEIQTERNEEDAMDKIKIVIGTQTFTATLADNAAAGELKKMLPFTINMSELNGNEKYAYLDKGLPTKTSRVDRIHTGDIMLFGSDCLVLFYKDFSTSYSYTPLGSVDDVEGFQEALKGNSVTVEFQY